jgi:hypothetical protein
LRLALAVLALTVTMIVPTFLALLIPTVGATPLMEPSLSAAGEAAIAMSAIAVGTEKKDRAAFAVPASPSPENHFAQNRHACSQAGLDKGPGSVAG